MSGADASVVVGRRWTEAEVAATIPERFERIAGRSPDRVAVDGDGPAVSYGELWSLAGDAALALGDRVGPGATVALLLPHGAGVLAGALGALRAGMTVVTLNPGDPPARLSELRVATEAELVVGAEGWRDRARAAGFAAEAIVARAGGLADGPVRVAGPDADAFLICTSGSTGRPKVVRQTHRNMLHNVLRYTNGLAVDGEDRIAWLASLSGGQGLATAWTALLNGATLCPWPILDRGVTGLAEWLEHERITIFDTLPSILRGLARTLPPDRTIHGLRLVRLASEPALRGDLDLFRRHFDDRTGLVSVLGSSETGIVAQTVIDAGAEVGAGRLPVGTAADGVEVHLLDPDGRPVADGDPGEIVVRGRYLSPGYAGDPELTAARFHAVEGGRSFSTGDLAVRADGGSLTVIGRADGQVKVRGHRLQLEEVEAALARQPAVAAAAVSARTNARGDVQLVAHVSPRAGAPFSAAELRRALRAVLPAHAVPTAFVTVETLPLTATGKVDRVQLAELGDVGGGGGDAEGAGVGASSEREALLASVWAEALERDRVAVDEPFLDLGGDSLSAAVIAAAAHELFGVELELRVFDAELTVARLAGVVEARQRGGSAAGGAHASSVLAAPRDRPLPLSLAQETMWRQAPGKGAGFNVATAYRLSGRLDVEALRAALEQFIARHEVLRTTYAEVGDGPRAFIHPPLRLELPVQDLRADPDPRARATELLDRDGQAPFDLGMLPLLRLRLVQMADDEHWLLRTVHHIVSDAVTWQLFLDELAGLYPAAAAGAPMSGPPALQFADYAVWERGRLIPGTPEFEAELDWWQPRLDPCPPHLPLPFERAVPLTEMPDHGGVVDVELDGGRAAPLDRLGRACGATPFMTRLAVYAALAALESGMRGLTIDSWVNARQRSELHEMVGPLVNRTVLRLTFDPALSMRAWIEAVRREVVELSDHTWIPFDLMIGRLRERGVPFPTMMTKFQLFHEPPVTIGELTVETLPRRWVAPWRFTAGVSRHAGGERWRAVFDPRLHDPDGVRAFLERCCRLAEAAASSPDMPLEASFAQLEDAPGSRRPGHPRDKGKAMLAVISSYAIEDYDRWKEAFDRDPFDRASQASGHRVFRSIDDPNVVFVVIEFDSVIAANRFRDQLRARRESGSGPAPLTAPTVVELVDSAGYRG